MSDRCERGTLLLKVLFLFHCVLDFVHTLTPQSDKAIPVEVEAIDSLWALDLAIFLVDLFQENSY